MGHHISWLPVEIQAFVECWWNTDVREDGSSAQAGGSLRKRGIRDALRRFLVDVFQRDAVTREEWGDLCNVQVRTREDVRPDVGALLGLAL